MYVKRKRDRVRVARGIREGEYSRMSKCEGSSLLHFKPKRAHSSGFRRADVLYYCSVEIAILRLHSGPRACMHRIQASLFRHSQDNALVPYIRFSHAQAIYILNQTGRKLTKFKLHWGSMPLLSASCNNIPSHLKRNSLFTYHQFRSSGAIRNALTLSKNPVCTRHGSTEDTWYEERVATQQDRSSTWDIPSSSLAKVDRAQRCISSKREEKEDAVGRGIQKEQADLRWWWRWYAKEARHRHNESSVKKFRSKMHRIIERRVMSLALSRCPGTSTESPDALWIIAIPRFRAKGRKNGKSWSGWRMVSCCRLAVKMDEAARYEILSKRSSGH
ncbi:hypothetical protein ALC56_13482 [Trachymyrmex septentrionalis]|uniref:Uncharacterized protein n=1 Tax=Trachymyrmex septentrionalis TaxID=34720 RepID=A0A195EW37_9HYME|nr:hypothetical protein ALC56_13482 [Trachymyrmex septentrionalis]